MPKYRLRINDRNHEVEGEPGDSLLSVLRYELDLPGSKYGCGEGQCGACTVLIDGHPRRSCITTAGAAASGQITTIEGLAPNGKLHPLQEAFLDAGALQCGYCTSGMLMNAAALLRATPDPTEKEIVRFMEGNICRCGTYPRIVAAIRAAAQKMKGVRR